jgi:hypothetical protein
MQTYTNPAFPNKTFRRLEVGERPKKGDFQDYWRDERWEPVDEDSFPIAEDECAFYYREITSETLLTTDQRLDIILAKLERIDAVLAKLNTNDNDK